MGQGAYACWGYGDDEGDLGAFKGEHRDGGAAAEDVGDSFRIIGCLEERKLEDEEQGRGD